MLDYDTLDKSDNVTGEQARCLVAQVHRAYITTACGLHVWKIDDQRYTENLSRVTCQMCQQNMEANEVLMDKKNGPTLIKVPAGVTYITCYGCNYLNRFMLRSGRNPVYSNNCTYDYDNQIKGPGPYPAEVRHISQETPPITPRWCPFLERGE